MFWLILGISAVFRFSLLVFPKSIWGDEIFSIQVAQMPLMQNLQASIQDVHPPLYYFILSFFKTGLGDSIWVYRLPSLAAGICVVFTVYALGTKLLSRQGALLACLLVAVSPYWLEASHEIRSYGVLALLTSAGTLCLLNALETRKNKWSLLFVLFAAASLYVEHYAWLWYAGLLAFIFMTNRAYLKKQFWVVVAAAPVLALLIYQALLRENVFAGYRLEEYRDMARLVKKFFGLFWHLSLGYTFSMVSAEKAKLLAKQSPLFWAHIFTTAFCFALSLRVFWDARKNNRNLFYLSLFGFWAPFLFLFIFYPIRLEARYLTFAAPFYFLLLSQGLLTLKTKWLRIGLVGLFILLNLHGTFYAISLTSDPIHKEDYIGLTQYLAKEASEDDVILFHKWPVEYYTKAYNVHVPGSHFESYDSWVQIGQAASGKVFYMYYRNMHEDVTARIYSDVRRDMLKMGFVPDGEPIVPGKKDGLLFVYVFKPASGSPN